MRIKLFCKGAVEAYELIASIPSGAVAKKGMKTYFSPPLFTFHLPSLNLCNNSKGKQRITEIIPFPIKVILCSARSFQETKIINKINVITGI